MSLRGYCRTLSERTACRPAMRMRRFTTIARTGRLTNKSVNFMHAPRSSSRCAPSVCSTLFRVRFGAIVRFHSVVNLDRRGVTEPEDAGADNFIARIQSGGDRDLIAAAALDLDDLLAHAAIGLARLWILHVGHDVHRITVGSVVDGRCRQWNNAAWLAYRQLDLNVHAGTQLPARVLHRGLDLDVAGLFVDHRIKGRNLPTERHSRNVGIGDMQSASDFHF